MDPISLVSEELAYYVLAKKSANLPGFGRFEAVYKEAEMDKGNRVLQPPSESIAFISEPNDDLTFSNYLKTISSNQDILSGFKLAISEALDKNQAVDLPGLGRYSQTKDGAKQFDYIEDYDSNDDFAWNEIKLKPIPVEVKTSVITETNVPNATEPQASPTNRFPYLRIGMIATFLAFCFAVYFNGNSISSIEAKAQNVNISPKDIKKEVFTASIDPSIEGEVLDPKDQSEILARQEAMTSTTKIISQEATLVTNTFGNQKNVKRQIKLIESLGFESDTLEKENGLTSTLLTLEYIDESDLASKLEEIKTFFPRAKIRK